MNVKLCSTDTRNFSFDAVYDECISDEQIKADFIKASKKHIKDCQGEYTSEYWKEVAEDLCIIVVPVNKWLRDKEEI